MNRLDGRKIAGVTMIAVFLVLVTQSNSQIEQAVRAARRVQSEYQRQSESAAADASREQLSQSMREDWIHRNICTPMWKQSSLSRRRYIESIVAKSRERREVINVCFESEVFMYDACGPSPDELSKAPLSSTCVGKREDWEPSPPPANYDTVDFLKAIKDHDVLSKLIDVRSR